MSDDPSKPGDDYKVGYRHPPRATRFRKGTSGNPRGRPKGARNLATVVASALDERVVVVENGRRKRITKLELVVKHLVNGAASGDPRSLRLLLPLIQAIEAKPLQTESGVVDDGLTALLWAAKQSNKQAKEGENGGENGDK
jgi:Family of unknown function (DUF5681)